MVKNIVMACVIGCIFTFNEAVCGSNPVVFNATDTFELKNGDLLFQDLDCGPLCNAIEEVTQGFDGAKFSHIGLVFRRRDRLYVIEAVSKGVSLTPVAEFLARSHDSEGKPKVAVGRLKASYQYLVAPAIKEALKFVGRPYNVNFNIHNDSLYCSELIYLAFRKAFGNRPFFHLQPMTYKSPATGTIYPAWADYFKQLKVHIPEGEPGINPGGISLSPYLDVYFPYGKPDGLKQEK